MKVLIACEFSGTVRNAFTARGHDATSCDLLPTESPGQHYQGDVKDIINDGFDLMIAHPPCTYLTCCAEWAYKEPKEIKKKLDPQKLYGQKRKIARKQASDFFMMLINAQIEMIAVENPIGVMSTRYRKPDQKIHPFEFGHPESKNTCLWLKNLPPLFPITSAGKTSLLNIPKSGHWENQTASGQNKLTPSKDRWKIRSITYQGIADAMANQWNY